MMKLEQSDLLEQVEWHSQGQMTVTPTDGRNGRSVERWNNLECSIIWYGDGQDNHPQVCNFLLHQLNLTWLPRLVEPGF